MAFKNFSEVAQQTSLDIALGPLSEMLGNHCHSWWVCAARHSHPLVDTEHSRRNGISHAAMQSLDTRQQGCSTGYLYWYLELYLSTIFKYLYWYLELQYWYLYLNDWVLSTTLLDSHFWKSCTSIPKEPKLYNTRILPIFLYGSECWADSKVDARRIDAVDQWCLRMMLEIKWHQFDCNDEVRRITKQPTHTAIIHWRCLSISGHIACMDDDADAKMILVAPPPGNWKRPLGRDRIQHDLRAYNLTLNKAVDQAQSRPLWRLMSTYCMVVCTRSGACQKRRL